jgi:crotonobetainyl-CoA:carnitine CoA-transferase CaiB-like acyl-CoA transferase
VQNYVSFLDDPHVRQSDFVAALEGGAFEGMPLMQLPGTGMPGARVPASAALGQHTREILEEFGYPTEEIDRLVRTAIVIDGKRKIQK